MLLDNSEDLKVKILVHVVVTFDLKSDVLRAKTHSKVVLQFSHFAMKVVNIEVNNCVPACMDNN